DVRGASLGEEPTPPTALALRVAGVWDAEKGALELPSVEATVDGARLEGSLALDDLRSDPCLDLSLAIRELDFARLFRSSGLGVPGGVAGAAPASPQNGELGSATIAVNVSGRLRDAATFAVTQRVDFVPPARVPAAISRLSGDFPHEVTGAGGSRTIEVSPASKDFIALADVPPLFRRALLLAEDSGFYGHRGIDFSEMPSAVLTNWARGRPAR